jgi:hypothetical protein
MFFKMWQEKSPRSAGANYAERIFNNPSLGASAFSAGSRRSSSMSDEVSKEAKR